jgi:hypothetical protein
MVGSAALKSHVPVVWSAWYVVLCVSTVLRVWSRLCVRPEDVACVLLGPAWAGQQLG